MAADLMTVEASEKGGQTREITIRKLNLDDAVLLSRIALKAYADHYQHFWYDEGKWYMDQFFSIQRLSQELADPNAVFYLAYYDRSPVGFIKLNIDAQLEGDEHKNALELERIYLNKEASGKGIGKVLIQLTFTIAKENNKELVWLKAMDTSEGPIDFYKKMGFEVTGTHRLKHQLMKEELRGMVIMKKRL